MLQFSILYTLTQSMQSIILFMHGLKKQSKEQYFRRNYKSFWALIINKSQNKENTVEIAGNKCDARRKSSDRIPISQGGVIVVTSNC